MDYEQLKTLPFSELRNMASDMGLEKQKSTQGYVDKITEAFKTYEEYKHTKLDRYKKVEQLGERGKDGVVYLVNDRDSDKDYAMKCFRKGKSSKRLLEEAHLQNLAAKGGVSPEVYDCDTVSKYIVMEKMDNNLYNILKKQKGKLSLAYQKQMINIFHRLDEIGVFHGDASPLNFMVKGRKLYIIDFGFAKAINMSLMKKYDTKSPNMKFMVIGFILKMREIVPEIRYEYLEQYLSKEERKRFGFKDTKPVSQRNKIKK